jgi:glycosyltransferase involved in cell wall biosynthesis
MARTISAIITVFNGEKYIAETIKSVLDQSVTISEIIIVDDGSTDNTLFEINAFSLPQIKVISQPNLGQSKSLNIGIKAASSDLLTFIDADDIWLPNKTKLQLAVFDKNPQMELCFGNIEEFISPEITKDDKRKLFVKGVIKKAKMKQVLMVPRDFFFRHGFFPEVPTMDFIAWYSLVKKNILYESFVDEILAKRRLHLSNISRRDNKNLEIVQTFKAILDQRRKVNQSNGQ